MGLNRAKPTGSLRECLQTPDRRCDYGEKSRKQQFDLLPAGTPKNLNSLIKPHPPAQFARFAFGSSASP